MSQHVNSTSAQRQRLLTALKKLGTLGISTLEARSKLDILHPSGRIKELRKLDYQILTIWSWERTTAGKHRVARYILVAEPF